MPAPVIAVWSPKGGVGKTLIATGLAMQLQRRCPGGALLLDLDAGKADVAALLKVSLRPSVLEFAGAEGRAVVSPGGLKVVPGPTRLIDEGLVTAEVAMQALIRASEAAAAVVVDLDSDLRDSTVVGLEQADAVLLVTTPDLLSIYGCRRFTQEAESVGFDLSRFRLVINQVSEEQEIPQAEIVSLAGVPLAGTIPDMPGLSSAINRGMISSTTRTNTDFAVALNRLANELAFAGIPAAAPPRQDPVGTVASMLPALWPALKRWWTSL